MGLIYRTDLTNLATTINSIRSKHGLGTTTMTVDTDKPLAANMNTIVNGMKGLTSSKYVSTVNASTVAAGTIMQQSYIDNLKTEATRLNNICTHDGSYNGSYYSSNYGSDYSSYNGSYKSSYDSHYSSYNGSYYSSNKGNYNSSYNGAVMYSGDGAYRNSTTHYSG